MRTRFLVGYGLYGKKAINIYNEDDGKVTFTRSNQILGKVTFDEHVNLYMSFVNVKLVLAQVSLGLK